MRPATAIASPPPLEPQTDAREMAKRHVERGARLYDEGKYEQALAAFEDAAATYASPDLQFNIGLCHERLARYDVAIRSFEAYLRNKPDAPDRSSVEHRIALLREIVHRDGEDAKAETTTEAPPDTLTLAPTVEPVSVPIDRDGARRGRRSVVAGGITIALGSSLAIAGGTVFGILGQRRADRVDAVLNDGNPEGLTHAQTRQLAVQADRWRAGAYATIGVGVVMVATGVALVITGQRRARAHALQPRWRVTGLALSGAF